VVAAVSRPRSRDTFCKDRTREFPKPVKLQKGSRKGREGKTGLKDVWGDGAAFTSSNMQTHLALTSRCMAWHGMARAAATHPLRSGSMERIDWCRFAPGVALAPTAL
jgi:hypothetical protein